jgi:hypothetical protein
MVKPALDMSSYVPYHFVPLTKGQLTLSCQNNRRSTPCLYRHNNWLADFFVGTGPKAPKFGSMVLELENRSHVRHLLPEGLYLPDLRVFLHGSLACDRGLYIMGK